MKHIKIGLTVFFVAFFLMTSNVSAKVIKISTGKKVTMDYVTKIDGKIVETTSGKQPVTFVMGDGSLIPGLSKKLEGLKAGDKRIIKLSPKNGYGEVLKEAIHEFPLATFPQGKQFVKGSLIQAEGEKGVKASGIVTEVDAEKVVVDFNHPYAGKYLEIEVNIVSVQ